MIIGQSKQMVGTLIISFLVSGCAEELKTNTSGEVKKELTSFNKKIRKSGENKEQDNILSTTYPVLRPVEDKTFLALERFEEPIGKIIKRVAHKSLLDTLENNLPLIQEKQLIFTGEGFQTRYFEKGSDSNLRVDYHYHLTSFLDRPLPPDFKDAIDLEVEDMKNSRSFIFHLPSVLLNKDELLEKNISLLDSIPFEEESIPEALSATKLLIEQGPEDMLVFRENTGNIDLLVEQENLNWELYHGR